MDKPTFSIIIPVYNSEKYLHTCIRSVLSQSYSSFELILVDDGSTDSSASICKSFAKSDNRIRYIFQNNSGTSSARNTGIDLANGYYITFMDNDDCWASPDALKEIKATIDKTGADLIMHQSFEFHSDERCTASTKTTAYADEVLRRPKSEQISFLISHGLMCSTVWTKVCSANLVKGDCPIYFPRGMRNEDTYWTGEALRQCNSIGWCDISFYAYRKGHEYAQTSKPLTVKQLADLSKICIEFCEKVNQSVKDPTMKESLYSFIAYPYIVWMGQSALFDNPRNTLEQYEMMESLSYLLDFDLNKNVHIVKNVSRLFSFSATCKLCSIMLKIKHRGIKAEQQRP